PAPAELQPTWGPPDAAAAALPPDAAAAAAAPSVTVLPLPALPDVLHGAVPAARLATNLAALGPASGPPPALRTAPGPGPAPASWTKAWKVAPVPLMQPAPLPAPPPAHQEIRLGSAREEVAAAAVAAGQEAAMAGRAAASVRAARA
ncbi:hypothetical protein Agub_g10320, partial [Astrephomene gubernaculifera]